MKLFEMSEGDIQMAVDAHTEYLYDLAYESAEPPRNCENCTYYEDRTCGMICSLLESEYSETALGDMTDKEYMEKFGKDPDDYCDDHEFWED